MADIFMTTMDNNETSIELKKRKRTQQQQQQSNNENCVYVTANNKIHTFQLINEHNQVITIGKKKGCDITLPSAFPGLSRLNLLLYIFPTQRLLLVVDMGSLYGIHTKYRSDTMQILEHSEPNDRNILRFSIDEQIILIIGDPNVNPCEIVINGKSCIVCFENPRQVLFESCKHYAVCSECNLELQTCPICKTNITHNKKKKYVTLNKFNTFCR
jgi:hypothetical protein